MRDGYVGDIGDFAKYSLLEALAAETLRLGVVWCVNPGEPSPGEGQLTEFPDLRECNPRLFDALAEARRVSRTLACIEERDILPRGTVFYRQPVPRGSVLHQGQDARRRWHQEALAAAASAELVFLDPDKGLVARAHGRRRAQTHVFYDEVQDYVERHRSVIVYQHAPHEGNWPQRALEALRELTGVSGAWALVFRRRGRRAFFVVPTDDHRDVLADRSRRFLESIWGEKKHFYGCGLEYGGGRAGPSDGVISRPCATQPPARTEDHSVRPVTIALDAELVSLLERFDRPIQKAARELIVVELYRRGAVSSGKAAELLGLTRQSFFDLASKLGIPCLRVGEADLEQEAPHREAL